MDPGKQRLEGPGPGKRLFLLSVLLLILLSCMRCAKARAKCERSGGKCQHAFDRCTGLKEKCKWLEVGGIERWWSAQVLKSHVHPVQYVNGVCTSMQYLRPYLV